MAGSSITVNNVPKAVILILLIVMFTALRAVDMIDQVTYVALIGPIGGYAVGNGIAARQGEPVEPVFGPSSYRPPDRLDDPFAD